TGGPSPRLLRAECFVADSLHAGLRAPEPTLSRGERVASVRFRRWVLALRPPALPSSEQSVARVAIPALRSVTRSCAVCDHTQNRNGGSRRPPPAHPVTAFLTGSSPSRH